MEIDLNKPHKIMSRVVYQVETIALEPETNDFTMGFKVFYYDSEPTIVVQWTHTHVPGQKAYHETPLNSDETRAVLQWLKTR